MATIAKIKCGSCRRKFDYYFQLQKERTIMCPYCYAEMSRDSAHNLFDTLGRFSENNSNLQKYAADRNEPLFQFDLLEV